MQKMYGGGIFMLVSLGMAAWVWNAVLSQPKTHPVGIAFGDATANTIDLHFMVTLPMRINELPKPIEFPNGETLMQNEMELIEEHFRLLDANGTQLKWEKEGHSKLIKPKHGAIVPEYFLVATLEPGSKYTLEWQPYRDEPKHWAYEFVAPADPVAYEMVSFEERK